MGRCIVKVGEGEYLIWSSIVDAPVSWIGDREYIVDCVRREFGEAGVRTLDQSLARADEQGHSALEPYASKSAEEFVRGNRAGDGEKELSFAEIREKYRRPPDG